MAEKKKSNKKVWWIVGIGSALAVGAGICAVLKGANVDTDQISETLNEHMSDAADVMEGYTEV